MAELTPTELALKAGSQINALNFASPACVDEVAVGLRTTTVLDHVDIEVAGWRVSPVSERPYGTTIAMPSLLGGPQLVSVGCSGQNVHDAVAFRKVLPFIGISRGEARIATDTLPVPDSADRR